MLMDVHHTLTAAATAARDLRHLPDRMRSRRQAESAALEESRAATRQLLAEQFPGVPIIEGEPPYRLRYLPGDVWNGLPVGFTGDWSVHCCLFDRDCWRLHYVVPVPLYLELDFLRARGGGPVRILLWHGPFRRSPYWKWRRRAAMRKIWEQDEKLLRAEQGAAGSRPAPDPLLARDLPLRGSSDGPRGCRDARTHLTHLLAAPTHGCRHGVT
jgi:hypothetical protein